MPYKVSMISPVMQVYSRPNCGSDVYTKEKIMSGKSSTINLCLGSYNTLPFLTDLLKTKVIKRD